VNQSSDKIGALIGLKRHEQPPPEYFDDFLREFQERRRAELLERSSFSLMLDRVSLWLREVGNVRWAYAAGVAYALLLLGLFFWPHGDPTMNQPLAPVVNEQIVVPSANESPDALPSATEGKEKASDSKALPTKTLPEPEF